jgi:hypothetical protein
MMIVVKEGEDTVIWMMTVAGEFFDKFTLFNAISTPFQRHFNAISTPFQRHFNARFTWQGARAPPGLGGGERSRP